MNHGMHSALLVALLSTASTMAAPGNETRMMLDSIARLVDGSISGVTDEYFQSLMTCMSTAPRLVESHDASWQGFATYFDSPPDDDAWGACSANVTGPMGTCKQYKESNLTAMDVGGIEIYEPCNSASNLAYYRTALGVCDHEGWAMGEDSQLALVQSYVHLAMGSFFWHGSHTFLGQVTDNRIIDVFAYLAFQVSTAAIVSDGSLNETSVAVLRDLSLTPRSATGIESAQALTDMFIDEPLDTWQAYIENLDMPNYYLTFAALVGNILTLVLDDDTVDSVFEVLAAAFNLPEEDATFMEESFFPTLREATADFQLSRLQKASLSLKLTGTALKMAYAFLWQEWVFTFGPKGDLMFRPRVNALGARLMPSVNALANLLTGYAHTDADIVQACQDVYPADSRCRAQESHSKWHEMGANGLLDMMFLSDDVYSLYSTGTSQSTGFSFLSSAASFAVRTVYGWTDLVKRICLA